MPVIEKNKVKVEKILRIPAPRVFDAIAQGKLFFNVSGDACSFQNDFRVGGNYRVKFMGYGITNVGKYLEIIPQQKIVFTWGDEGADAHFPRSKVTIQLFPEGDSTRLLLEHSGFETLSQAEDHNGGWTSGLTDLIGELETHQLRIVRNFSVPVQRLFEACSKIDVFFKAVAGGAGKCDLKVGGQFQVPGKNGSNVSGKYLEIVPNQKLKFTWNSGCDDATGAKKESLVTLLFRATKDGSSLELLHEKLPSSDSAERHRLGWSMVTNMLLEEQKSF